MAINKKLIHFKSKQKFNEELANGNILETSIVFILDTKEIYTHGQFYDGSTFDPSNIEKSIENIINNKADKTELPTKTSDLTNDSGFITINDVSVGNLLKTYTFYVDNINTSSYVYTITQSELEEIQNADIVYIFIDRSKKKIQLTSKIENDSISFFGYDFESYPSTVFSTNITVVKVLDNIEVRILIDPIGIDDYISENDGTSWALGVCLFEEFVDGAEIEIVDNIDIIPDSALNNPRPVILTLMDSNIDKAVLLHGPYMLYSSDDMPSIKFIGLFNDLTIECVLSSEDGFLYGTLHIKSKSEEGSVDLSAYATKEELNSKQDKLTSGTNIKTINGQSLLGSGNITISGGSNTGSSAAYGLVEHGTSDTTFTLTPNTFHVWEEVDSLTLELDEETARVANEYLFLFTSGSTATTLILPDNIKWSDEFTIEATKIYQISILNALGTVMSWEFVPSIVFPVTLSEGNNGNIGISLYSYLQNTYGEPTSRTTLNEEIINNYNGNAFNTIEYGTYVGLTGYWLNGYSPIMITWVLFEDGYLQRVIPSEDSGGAE